MLFSDRLYHTVFKIKLMEMGQAQHFLQQILPAGLL